MYVVYVFYTVQVAYRINTLSMSSYLFAIALETCSGVGRDQGQRQRRRPGIHPEKWRPNRVSRIHYECGLACNR